MNELNQGTQESSFASDLFGRLEIHWDDITEQWILWRKIPSSRIKQRLRPMLASEVAILSRKGLLHRYGLSDALTITSLNNLNASSSEEETKMFQKDTNKDE